jgi:hypothetical protein
MFPLSTTLTRIKKSDPALSKWATRWIAVGKAADEPISYEDILDSFGLQIALECGAAEPQYGNLWRLYAVWCARQVQHLMTDERSLAALNVAERYTNDEATDEELRSAWMNAVEVAGERWKPSIATENAWVAAWYLSWPSVWATHKDAVIASVAASETAFLYHTIALEIRSAAFRQLVTTGTLPNGEES